jgi:hypothetical protein
MKSMKSFFEKHRTWLNGLHRKVLSAIVRCRTAALLYGLLFRASAAALLEVAADPGHLGAEIGINPLDSLPVCDAATVRPSRRDKAR